MKVFIFRTDIKTKKRLKSVKQLFNDNPVVSRWNVDLEDIDNVLKVVGPDHLEESDIIRMVRVQGFQCEALPE